MVTQKPISARIDHTILLEIEQETMLGYETRNGVLNKGAKLYLKLIDTRRELNSVHDQETKIKILKGFLRLCFPGYKYDEPLDCIYKLLQ